MLDGVAGPGGFFLLCPIWRLCSAALYDFTERTDRLHERYFCIEVLGMSMLNGMAQHAEKEREGIRLPPRVVGCQGWGTGGGGGWGVGLACAWGAPPPKRERVSLPLFFSLSVETNPPLDYSQSSKPRNFRALAFYSKVQGICFILEALSSKSCMS